MDQPLDRGHIVSVGGADAFTNELLGTDDNAVLAVSLLAPRPGTAVSVLWGMTATGSHRSLVEPHLHRGAFRRCGSWWWPSWSTPCGGAGGWGDR